MPLVQISMRNVFTSTEKKIIHNLVHESLVEALNIPTGDCNQRMMVFDEEHFMIPEGKSERYLLIEVILFPGHATVAKRNFYALLTASLKQVNIEKEDVTILLREPEFDNWGIQGIPGSEIAPGVTPNVW